MNGEEQQHLDHYSSFSTSASNLKDQSSGSPAENDQRDKIDTLSASPNRAIVPKQKRDRIPDFPPDNEIPSSHCDSRHIQAIQRPRRSARFSIPEVSSETDPPIAGPSGKVKKASYIEGTEPAPLYKR